MEDFKEQLQKIFIALNKKIEEINISRKDEGVGPVQKTKIQILGQISLLANQQVSSILSLAQTGDSVLSTLNRRWLVRRLRILKKIKF